MTMMYLLAGGNTGKKLRSRFGGESAWKQHAGDGRELSATFKARRDALVDSECDLGDDAPVSVDYCQYTGEVRPYNGSVTADGVTVVYRHGKLICAHGFAA